VVDAVKEHGTKVVLGQAPKKIERQSSGQLKVQTNDSGQGDTFDTVLLAVGVYLKKYLHIILTFLLSDLVYICLVKLYAPSFLFGNHSF
jgi:hypothetical protein